MSVYLETGFTGKAQPIDQPRIGFEAISGTGSSAQSATGVDPDWVTDGETWTIWRAQDTNFAALEVAFGQATTIDYIGIAAHNLGSIGATINIQTLSGGSFSTIAGMNSLQPDDDSAILALFDPVSVDGIRLAIFGDPTSPPEVAVFQGGRALELPRLCNYVGMPISESKQIRYRHQQSITGDVLGRAVEGAELQFAVEVDNLPETFRIDTDPISWKGLVRHIDDVGPFFIAGKPSSYPDEVAYARCRERPRFERVLANADVAGAVTFQCLGYASP